MNSRVWLLALCSWWRSRPINIPITAGFSVSGHNLPKSPSSCWWRLWGRWQSSNFVPEIEFEGMDMSFASGEVWHNSWKYLYSVRSQLVIMIISLCWCYSKYDSHHNDDDDDDDNGVHAQRRVWSRNLIPRLDHVFQGPILAQRWPTMMIMMVATMMMMSCRFNIRLLFKVSSEQDFIKSKHQKSNDLVKKLRATKRWRATKRAKRGLYPGGKKCTRWNHWD